MSHRTITHPFPRIITLFFLGISLLNAWPKLDNLKIKNPLKTIPVLNQSTGEINPEENLSSNIELINNKLKKSKGGKDEVLLLLEKAAIFRLASHADLELTGAYLQQNSEELPAQLFYLNQATLTFDEAELRINTFEETASLNLKDEASALLTNQANLKYKGRAYDRVMMNTYKALNYMQVQDFASARVELNRSLQRQRDAVAENAKEIEKANKEATTAKSEEGGYDMQKAKEDPRVSQSIEAIEAELDLRIKAYGDYVNPFSVFLDGLFFLYAGDDASDLERARKSFQRVASMVEENKYVRSDLLAATNAQIPSNTTYVIFETGLAPKREEMRIDIPTFLVTDEISYVGGALPKLAFHDGYVDSLSVKSEDTTYSSQLLCSMDSVIAQDIKNELPVIRTKTFLSTGIKAGLDATLQNEIKDSFGITGQIIGKIGGAALQKSLNKADVRSWRFLPKEYQQVRLQNPSNGKLIISAGEQSEEIYIEPEKVNVVLVANYNPESPLWISQFTF